MKAQNKLRARLLKQKKLRQMKESERGFTLLETTIALVIMLFVALGAASLFAYSIEYNSAGNDRAQSTALAQQRVEQLRNARFPNPNPPIVLSPSLAGGDTTQNVDGAGNTPCGAGQRCYTVRTIIDDNPATAAVDVDTASTLKKITVKVTPQGARTAWARSANGADTIDTVSVVTQRTKN